MVVYPIICRVWYIPGGAGFLPGSEGIAGTLEPTYGYFSQRSLTSNPRNSPPKQRVDARRKKGWKEQELKNQTLMRWSHMISHPINWQFYVMLTTDVIKNPSIFPAYKSHPFL